MSKAIHKMLPELDVFKYLDQSDCEIIEKYMFKYEYKEGSYVFKEGTHGGYMFFIVDGTVDIIKQFDTKKTTIAQLGSGRSVGEMS
ncbi:MAG: cyclic nucleotide-binding domain-containing protein, partial [Pseudomonadales bacterium]